MIAIAAAWSRPPLTAPGRSRNGVKGAGGGGRHADQPSTTEPKRLARPKGIPKARQTSRFAMQTVPHITTDQKTVIANRRTLDRTVNAVANCSRVLKIACLTLARRADREFIRRSSQPITVCERFLNQISRLTATISKTTRTAPAIRARAKSVPRRLRFQPNKLRRRVKTDPNGHLQSSQPYRYKKQRRTR